MTNSYSGFGKELIPYPGLFIAYALGALMMGISEKGAAIVFGGLLLGTVAGSFAASWRLNHAE